MRKLRRSPSFRLRPTETPRAVQGPLYLWFDDNSGLAFLTIGVKRPAHHRFLSNGIGLRFDDQTKKFVGFGWVVMPYKGSIQLPIWAQFTLMADAIDALTDK